MFQKLVLPLLAVVGVCFGVLAAMRSAATVAPPPAVSEPPPVPYAAFVAGAGIVEPNTEAIAIGTQVPGVVARVCVQVGDAVKAGDPLFILDDRATRATQATLAAAVQVAQVQVASTANEVQRAGNLPDRGIMSVDDLDQRRFAKQTADAQLAQAIAALDANCTALDLLTVRAPVTGTILQVKVHPGEFAPAGVLSQPLIQLGSIQPLYVRTDVDENDAWRVRSGAAATAFLRGNKAISTALEFVRFEPYVIPKVSLTGESTERIDTRVLQVIYRLKDGTLPIFVGQQMDVYIDDQSTHAGESKPGKDW